MRVTHFVYLFVFLLRVSLLSFSKSLYTLAYGHFWRVSAVRFAALNVKCQDSASKALAALGLAARITKNFRCFESGKDVHIWTTTNRRYGLSLGFRAKVALASRLTFTKLA